MKRTQQAYISGPLLLILAVAWIIYSPGLTGTFLFDDFANIPALGKYGPINNLENLRLYLTGGIAGPSGRPIALASFLIDAQNWPADPRPFLRTNILIHLINGGLLYLLLLLLLKQHYKTAPPGRTTTFVAATATAMWLWNPFLVSSTLYIVQRMTLLSGTFVLAGLAGYVYGRSLLDNHPRKAYWWMSLSLGAGTVLATFSKENGVLLPLLAVCIEYTVFSKQNFSKQPHALWKTIFLIGPALVPFVYVAYKFPHILSSYSRREFSFEERLFTEARILFDYLYNLLIPHAHTTGLFHDSFQVSSTPLNPPTTALAISGIFLLIFIALRYRQRKPLLALAILFFFAGHVLESTVYPLELYFEHRNYVPALLLFLPIADWLVSPPRNKIYGRVFLTTILIVFSAISYQRTSLWGQPTALLLLWAQENPDSTRAQTVATDALVRIGAKEQALHNLDRVLESSPDNIPLQLRRLLLKINNHSYSRKDLDVVSELVMKKPFDFLAFNLLEQIALTAKNRTNPEFTLEDALLFVEALSQNPNATPGSGPDHLLQHIKGQLLLAQGKPREALHAFYRSLKSRSSPNAGMKQIAILASAHAYVEAFTLAERVKDIIRKKYRSKISTIKRDFYLSELERIRLEILKEQSK